MSDWLSRKAISYVASPDRPDWPKRAGRRKKSLVLPSLTNRPVFILAVHTGLRRSELLGLKWRYVDLEMASLSVTQVLHRNKGGRFIFERPKTQKGRRSVDLTPTSALMLRDHREAQQMAALLLGVTWSDDWLVFSNPEGSPFVPDNVSSSFRKIARRAGLNGVTLHQLRHTHATLLLRQGVHPKVVQERLGHSTISTTLDIYSHVTPSMQREAALKLQEALA